MNEIPAPRFPETEPYFVGDERTNHERMLADDWYIADDPDNARIVVRAHTMLHHFERVFAEGEKDCWDLLHSAIPGLDGKAHLLPPVHVDYGDNIAMDEGIFVNYGFVVLDAAGTSIGAHCRIGPNVQLLTPVHPLEPTPRTCSLEAANPITIGDSVWLGGGTIAYPGVTIGDDCVIDASPVVIEDIPASSLAVGNPVRALRRLDDSTFGPRHQRPSQETP